MDDIALDGLVQSGTKSDRRSAGLLGIAGGNGLLDALAESLQAGLYILVARSISERFAGGFECGLGIGHGD